MCYWNPVKYMEKAIKYVRQGTLQTSILGTVKFDLQLVEVYLLTVISLSKIVKFLTVVHMASNNEEALIEEVIMISSLDHGIICLMAEDTLSRKNIPRSSLNDSIRKLKLYGSLFLSFRVIQLYQSKKIAFNSTFISFLCLSIIQNFNIFYYKEICIIFMILNHFIWKAKYWKPITGLLIKLPD